MMRVVIDDNINAVTPEQLAAELRQLPLWRRDQALAFRFHTDRVLCTRAYLLLEKLLYEEYGLAAAPAFDYLPAGKPVLKDYPQIHFNMSHCPKGVMCVVGDRPVGCDIESIMESMDEALLRHCCNAAEAEEILASPDPCLAFTRIWTIKEAVLKLTGDGLSDDLPKLLTPDLLRQLTLETHVCADREYVWSVAY